MAAGFERCHHRHRRVLQGILCFRLLSDAWTGTESRDARNEAVREVPQHQRHAETVTMIKLCTIISANPRARSRRPSAAILRRATGALKPHQPIVTPVAECRSMLSVAIDAKADTQTHRHTHIHYCFCCGCYFSPFAERDPSDGAFLLSCFLLPVVCGRRVTEHPRLLRSVVRLHPSADDDDARVSLRPLLMTLWARGSDETSSATPHICGTAEWYGLPGVDLVLSG